MTTLDLFADSLAGQSVSIGANAWLLRGYALPYISQLLSAIDMVVAQAPFRHMVTPGGFKMSVALTNCGQRGWTSDRRGYRYSTVDPLTAKPWPVMPALFTDLAQEAAQAVGFQQFVTDACLINRYLPNSRLSLHQDRNERDFCAPIVSVSLGMTAIFLFGGLQRTDPTLKIPLLHGDVVIWGGQDRLCYHGIAPLKDNPHVLLGNQRINLTFRMAG